jgi:hypothetical protein
VDPDTVLLSLDFLIEIGGNAIAVGRQQPAETLGASIARVSFLWRSRRYSAAVQILLECVSRQPHFLIIRSTVRILLE